MYKPKSQNEWALLTITAAQALLVIVLDLYILLTYFDWVTPYVYQVPKSYVVPVNFAIVVLGNLYQAVLAWDGLRIKNNLLLYSVYLLNASLLFFSVMRYRQTKIVTASLQRAEAMGHNPFTNRHINYWKNVEPALLTVTAIIGLSWLVQGVLVCLLHREFKWAIYRHIRGSLEMLRRYFAYQLLDVLMRLEIYFSIAFIVLYGLISVHYIQPEFALTMAMIPALTILLILTILFTKSENYLGAIFAIILRLGEITYLLSRILLLTSKSRRANTALKDEMLFFAGTAIALATLACFNAMICVFNFRKGLRPLLGGYSWNQAPPIFEPIHQHRYRERIELD